MQNNITRLASPFKSDCYSSWAETGYSVSTAMKYSLAVKKPENEIIWIPKQ